MLWLFDLQIKTFAKLSAVKPIRLNLTGDPGWPSDAVDGDRTSPLLQEYFSAASIGRLSAFLPLVSSFSFAAPTEHGNASWFARRAPTSDHPA
jgi:hypothetical protein